MLIEYSAPEDLDFTAASFTLSVFFTPLHFPFDLLVSTFFPLKTTVNLHLSFFFPMTASN